MSRPLTRKANRCYLLVAYAPEGVTISEANRAFNAFIADPQRGMVLFHDHFVGRAGGLALFWVRTSAEWDALVDYGPLTGWEVHVHALIYTNSAVGFLKQIDFTTANYRGIRLSELLGEYRGGK